MTKRFKDGDKVQHKGGGPVMAVKASSDHLAYCEWLGTDGVHQDVCTQDQLEPAAPASARSGQAQPSDKPSANVRGAHRLGKPE